MDSYKNNKNGEVYKVLSYNIVDATNGREKNDFMVLYEKDSKQFVRDRKEFFNKFTQVLDDEN